MKRRRLGAQGQTLTKIDLSSLKPKPFATSQHVTGVRGRVTTTLDLAQPSLAPPPEPTFFGAGPLNHPRENSGDEEDGDDNDVEKEYYAARVRTFLPLSRLVSHISVRTIR